MVERRKFLIGCGAAFVATGLGPATLIGATSGRAYGQVGRLQDRVRALLNSLFYIRDEAWNGLTMELIEVRDGPQSPHLEQFSVRLRGPLAPQLPPGLYQVVHREVGTFLLYMEPIREDATGSYYGADFCLLIS